MVHRSPPKALLIAPVVRCFGNGYALTFDRLEQRRNHRDDE